MVTYLNKFAHIRVKSFVEIVHSSWSGTMSFAKCLTFSKYAITICETKLFIFLLSGGERYALQVGMRQEMKVWKG